MSNIFRDYSFGGWIHHYRIEQEKTLRQAALDSGFDVGNLSKLERSELPPPNSREKVIELLTKLGIATEKQELLIGLALNFHLGKVQERFSKESLTETHSAKGK